MTIVHRALDIPVLDDQTSQTNMITALLRFSLGEVVIQVAKSIDKSDTPYLMFRIDRLCADAAVTSYGVAVQAGLGGIQMVDKIHTGVSGEYLEMLSSTDGRDLISVVYRKVRSHGAFKGYLKGRYLTLRKHPRVHYKTVSRFNGNLPG